MKKQLLNESEIRKMMKFANMSPLTNSFVDRLNEKKETLSEWGELEEELEDEDPAAAGAAGGLQPGDVAPDAPAEPEGEVDDVEAEVDPVDDELGADPEGGDILELVASAMESFKSALELAGPAGKEAAAGLEVDQTDTAEAPVGDEEMGDPMAADAELGPEDPMGDPMDMGDEEMVAEVVDEDAMEEDLVQEVARRVAQRLASARRRPRRRRR